MPWRRIWWWTWRTVAVLPAPAVAFVVLWLDGTAGETWGWLRAAAWLVPLAVLPSAVLFRRRLPAATALVVACGLATWLTAMAPLMPTRIEAAIDDLDVPGELVDERSWGVDIWGGRPSVEREYRTRGNRLDALAAELRADGWSVRVDRQWNQVWAARGPVELFAAVEDGRIDLSVEPR